MRHERVLDKGNYSRVMVPALWPAGPQIGHLPLVQIEEREAYDSKIAAVGPQETQNFAPTPAAPDVPASVGIMIVSTYVALIAAFALATAGSAESIFAITIAALFVAVYFTLPRIFFGVEPKGVARPDFDRFMREGMQTLTGHSSGRDALVQMMIVPVLLTFGVLAMGVAVALSL